MNEFMEHAQVKEFHTGDMLKLAVQNMKEAQEPEEAHACEEYGLK